VTVTGSARIVCRVKGKGKGYYSTYSITERKVPEPIPVLGSQPAGDVNHKPDGRLPLLPTSLQLPRNPKEGCYQFCCLVNRGTMGVNSLPKRRGCDLNPGPSAPESSTLTTRLQSHPVCRPGSIKWHGVRPSVCLSQHGPTAANPLLQVCCCEPGGQAISIDCCSSGGQMRAVPRCQRT